MMKPPEPPCDFTGHLLLLPRHPDCVEFFPPQSNRTEIPTADNGVTKYPFSSFILFTNVFPSSLPFGKWNRPRFPIQKAKKFLLFVVHLIPSPPNSISLVADKCHDDGENKMKEKEVLFVDSN